MVLSPCFLKHHFRHFLIPFDVFSFLVTETMCPFFGDLGVETPAKGEAEKP